MSFRVKLRIKSVKPYQPPAPADHFIPRVQWDEDRLRKLYDEAVKMPMPGEGQWTRRWMGSPGLPDPGMNPTCASPVAPWLTTLCVNGRAQ